MKRMLFGSALALVLGAQTQAASRDTIHIVGSSTVYPFATVVAEHFGRATRFKTPRIESTGSGGGMKLFCAGVGVNHPDITNASRRIKKSEFAKCQANGVKEIVEIKIGYDGIAIANSRKAPRFDLSRKDLFLALARQVPDPAAPESVPNPYRTWKQVNPSLPDVGIEVLGPPPTSGTRDAFAELAMEGGCKQFAWIKALKHQDKKRYKAICHAIREDGPYIEAGENDNLIVKKLVANPRALGIFGYSYLEQNADQLQGSLVDGVAPEFELIADGSYPVSRPLFFYVKKAHVGRIPSIREYLAEFTSEKAWGDDGYLVDKGLIPMPEDERSAFAKAARELTPLEL
ncbi:PstS family phosphate ABC transporter substrate-binding protein [endosymbiont of unidentified scaly snail isolate Monju]|uniref:PstS family phosphate ABC transporter substrate-binding protein n=1 Tax=endosymbiont of unidentified scaly snail isolate Monju TaxID=1248727 RepID=UPI000389282B|nr:PstS family phosphate ABC transporter substrate-binding protein [endosymbiont of unidentified scaly snail isolate Monju]BAN69964.1 phosphate transport system substrate-binding protein [endosymbiont of unidentified scaly snail isolate Monju]